MKNSTLLFSYLIFRARGGFLPINYPRHRADLPKKATRTRKENNPYRAISLTHPITLENITTIIPTLERLNASSRPLVTAKKKTAIEWHTRSCHSAVNNLEIHTNI
jgi:hypothetical protein